MEIWSELKSIVQLFDLRTSESYLVYIISCSSKIFFLFLESFLFLFSATNSDYWSGIQNSWFASKEAGLLWTAVITALQCLLQSMCVHLQHWRSHKNPCQADDPLGGDDGKSKRNSGWGRPNREPYPTETECSSEVSHFFRSASLDSLSSQNRWNSPQGTPEICLWD